MTKARVTAKPKPATPHPASCVTCKTEARILHARTHLSPEAQAQIRKTERAYAVLDVEFQRERDAERAALARGMRPVPGQWKLDQRRLVMPGPRPEARPLPAGPIARAQPELVVYPDLWHEEVAS